jgi:hypothetical protein
MVLFFAGGFFLLILSCWCVFWWICFDYGFVVLCFFVFVFCKVQLSLFKPDTLYIEHPILWSQIYIYIHILYIYVSFIIFHPIFNHGFWGPRQVGDTPGTSGHTLRTGLELHGCCIPNDCSDMHPWSNRFPHVAWSIYPRTNRMQNWVLFMSFTT